MELYGHTELLYYAMLPDYDIICADTSSDFSHRSFDLAKVNIIYSQKIFKNFFYKHLTNKK